jgi:UDP-GlcNAc:undecaprenyl-phosphate GlcNAc-1-phosphate transferase
VRQSDALAEDCITLLRMSLWDTLGKLLGERSVVLGFVIAAAIVLVGTPLTIRLSGRIGGVESSDDRPRIHRGPIPRIGGLAIVAGILIPALVLLDNDRASEGILIGLPLVAAVGLVDDLRGLRPRVKFIAVGLAALIPVAGWDMTFHQFNLPLIGAHDIGWMAYPLTVLWITVVANLVNLIDGMDALAAGIVCIAAAAFAILAASFGRMEIAALSAITCGATLGFLRHNYHPAKVFMGDTGALTLGYLVGSLAVEGVLKTTATIALVAPLLVISVPILDTSFVVLKRLKYHRPPWSPDHNHFYHRFLRIGFTQRRTAAYLHAWSTLLAGYALLLRFVPPRPYGIWNLGNTLIGAAAGLLVIATSVYMVYSLEIIKARHLQAFGLRRLRQDETEPEGAVEEALTAGRP